MFGLTNPMPDLGWSENEARQDSSTWRIPASGSFCLTSTARKGSLLRVLEAEGARLTYHDFRNGAALIRYEFPG